ncbi:MME [Lepeophtheirus salmonis]|uniref:MME n=1 Tax=Lepeophtheirus salmonis TaxID=72036 RepID=A0A7R8D291_LEPSM|nr:MME [Lepeophtheirus salmonis]CAF3003319.1 MME [Lepeophtheirus salmonis]
MQSVCEHNLYICRCSPPSHPSDSLERRRSPRIPVYVSQTSVAVMTSPTLTTQTLPLRHSCSRRRCADDSLPTVSYYGEILPSSSSATSPLNNPIKLRFPRNNSSRTHHVEVERRRSCLEKTVFFTSSYGSFGRSPRNIGLSLGDTTASTTKLTTSLSSNDVSSSSYQNNHLAANSEAKHHHSTKKVCISEECTQMSKSMMANLDTHVDPCHSFYQFACGGWMIRNAPPPRRLVHSVMSKRRDEMDLQLRDFILSIEQSEADHADKQLRRFYDSCMDVSSIRAKGYVPAVQLIHDEFSDYFKDNFIVDHDSDRKRLTQLILRLLKSNGTPIFDITLDLSPSNSSRYIGVIRVPARSGLLPKLTRSSRSFSYLLNRLMRHRRKRNSRGGYKYVSRKEIFKSFEVS